MYSWKRISTFVTYSTKGITPRYVDKSSIMVLNQKCIRNNRIDYSFAQFTDDSVNIAETKFVKKGDILVNSTGTGTAGRCAFVSNIPDGFRLIVDSHILILRCSSYYEAQCLSYVLFSFEKTLMSFMTGSSGQSELDKVVLLDLQTQMPSDSIVQRDIVLILSSLDRKIEINNCINDRLDAMAKTLYDYWFMQFDFPDKNGKPYRSCGGKMVWNEKCKREIPEGWDVKYIREVANTASGGTPLSTQKEYYENGNIPWINSGELNSPFIVEGKYFITRKGLENSSAKLFNADTLLVAMYGATAGKVSLLRISACTNQAICAIIPKLATYTYFLKFVLGDLYEHLINLSSGSARDNLSQDVIKDLNFINPKEHVLLKFDEKVKPIINQISLNLKENRMLAELRDWLLPMLMNGQVKVKDALSMVNMAAEPEEKYTEATKVV